MAAQRILSCAAEAVAWLRARVAATAELRTDSRQVAAGEAFIAWPGYAHDGRAFVANALAAGAAACLVEADGLEAWGFNDERIAALPGLKAATGAIADAWYGEPSARLNLVATTGTNGKTSTAWWTAQALSLAGQRCGVVGTLGVGEPPTRLNPQAEVVATGLTTPDPLTLHRSLRAFERSGFAACALEASSIGVVEQRLAAARIQVALYTNFTPDHLDYHGSMEAYWAAKRVLFDWPGLRAAVVNLDDAKGAELAAELQGQGRLDLWTYSQQPGVAARLRAEAVRYEAGGLAFTLVETAAGGAVDRAQLRSTLIGAYNVSNLLAVLGGLRALGLPLAQVAAMAAEFTPVPGRMDRVSALQGCGADLPQVVVDYAHTPDAMDQALQALRPFAQARGGRLWCVFGCGGNRDATKRPVMGRIASERADEVIVTSDNPRLEEPAAIVVQVAAGCAGPARVRTEVGRAQAIALALAEAAPADVLLLAGKGHEDYQDAGGVKRPFLDAAVAAQAQQRRVAQAALPPLGELHAMLAARVPQAKLVGDAETVCRRVHSDSRSLRAGDLFVALRGERFDAADFLPQARGAGAVAALAERGLATAGLSGLEVPDALAGLQQLATAWRARLALPLIGVTGSNGKTTVTQMIASILRAWRGATAHATAGNLNNHIGVPLTVLGLRGHHRAAVIELGMNHPGEIAELAAIAQPTVALVNNAQREHQEFMKTVEAVARENGAALSALPVDGVAVFPADDPYTPLWRDLAGARCVLTFALDDARCDAAADLQAAATWAGDHWAVQMRSPAGEADLRLAVAGRHNVKNALAATACALAAGCPLADIVRGLQAFAPVKGRSQVELLHTPAGDVTLVDDSYNANPDSVRAAIEVLADLPAPRWLLLGDMGEVGDQGPAFHAEVGALAAERGIEALWCAGTLARHAAAACAAAGGATTVRAFDDTAALLQALGGAAVRPVARSVLVKGSRFMKMEQAVAVLRERQPASGPAEPQGAADAG